MTDKFLHAEECVIGALMLDVSAFDRVKGMLSKEVFYSSKHAVIFEAAKELNSLGQPIDLLTMTNQLTRTGKVDDIGGPVYLVECTNKVASAANIEYHCLILKQFYLKRKETELALQLVKDLQSGVDVFEAQKKHADQREKIMTGFFPSTEKALNEIDALAPILKAMETDELQGVATGYPDMDDLTSGWQNTDLIIIAARPGVGKTSLMICLALAAAKNGFPVGFLSLEMSSVQLKQKLFSVASGISTSDQRTGNISHDDFNKLLDVNKYFADLDIYFNEEAMVLMEILAAVRRMVMEGCKLIIIDYLQLININGFKGNRNNEVSKVTRQLKLAAKKLNVPIIAGSQLSRPPKGSTPKMPQLTDLRDSGSIEQDADIVAFIHRPAYYMPDEIEQGQLTQDEIEEAFISFAKHRNGEMAILKKRWIAKFTRFESWMKDTTLLPNFPSNGNMPRGGEDDTPF